MHHSIDNEWRMEDNEQILTSRWPDFHKVMAAHYTERLQQVVAKGLQYSAQYFLIRNQLKYHNVKKLTTVICLFFLFQTSSYAQTEAVNFRVDSLTKSFMAYYNVRDTLIALKQRSQAGPIGVGLYDAEIKTIDDHLLGIMGELFMFHWINCRYYLIPKQ